jgi:MerR family redox-sensitive transcriptional activator SoxR
MPARSDLLTIGEVAIRSGHATSAIRYYEAEGLLRASRTPGGHRLFPRHVLRRLAFISSAQRIGLTLDEIADALATLPPDRAPTKAQWSRLSGSWQRRLDQQIADLEQLRGALTTCIGCGCLSLRTCGLFNAGDQAASAGAGPRYLLGDDPPDQAQPDQGRPEQAQ